MLYKINSGADGSATDILTLPFLNPTNAKLLTLDIMPDNYLNPLNEYWDRFDTVSIYRYYTSK